MIVAIQPRFPEIGPARIVNGYIAYYTKDRFTVYEHRVAAERRLGRALLPDEVVHHKNEDKSDNRDENLEVLTGADHQRLHHETLTEIPCVTCGKEFRPSNSKIRNCSDRCAKISIRKVRDRPPLPVLNEMLKTTSKMAIARKFGVSESAVRKWFRARGEMDRLRDF